MVKFSYNKGDFMNLSQAFTKRVREILKEKKITQYKLEQLTGLYHSTISDILNSKYKSANFKNMVLIIRGLGLSLSEFFDSPIFEFDNLHID